MFTLSLIISIIALVFAYLAYTKSGGSIEEMKRKVEDLGVATESLRNRTADILENFERKVRGEKKKGSDQPGDTGGSHEDTAGASQH